MHHLSQLNQCCSIIIVYRLQAKIEITYPIKKFCGKHIYIYFIERRHFVCVLQAKLLPILRSTEMDPVVATETEEQSENNEERLMSSNETEGITKFHR